MPQYSITTPEQIQLRYHAAGLVSRAMAWLLDQLIIMVVRVGLLFGLARAGAYGLAVMLVLYFALDFGYYVFCELYFAGQSPGKKRFHLRVISSTGAH